MEINPNKFLRTGDSVIDKVTGKECKVHYVVEKGGQHAFMGRAKDLEQVQVDNGNEMVFKNMDEIELLGGKND